MAAGSSKPVLYYTFENGTGTSVTDRSAAGNNFNGAFCGTPTWDSTNKMRGSYSLSVDSSNTEAIGPIGTVADFKYFHETGIFTVAGWFKAGNTTARLIICGTTPSAATNGFFMAFHGNSSNRLSVYYPKPGNYYYSDNDAITDTDWHHIVITSDATNIYFYVDGSLHSSIAWTYYDAGFTFTCVGNAFKNMWLSSMGSSYLPMCGDAYPYTWYGNIDEYSIWNVAFTAANVTTLYNGGTPYDISNGLVAPGLPSGIRDIGGVSAASVKTVGGVAVSNVKNIMGVS